MSNNTLSACEKCGTYHTICTHKHADPELSQVGFCPYHDCSNSVGHESTPLDKLLFEHEKGKKRFEEFYSLDEFNLFILVNAVRANRERMKRWKGVYFD